MKKIGILGTGVVGQTIGKKMVSLGYEVMMGSRTSTNEKAAKFVQENGSKALQGAFEESAKFGELIFNCTKGEATIEILKMAGVTNFNGKTVIDISNPLDFSNGMPPTLRICNTDSLAEHVQHTLPGAHVVKTLNIVNCEVMVNPKKSGGDPTMFLSGNNAEAKDEVRNILIQFGWNDIVDLGDITTARGTEMMLPIWVRTYMATGNAYIGFKIIK